MDKIRMIMIAALCLLVASCQSGQKRKTARSGGEKPLITVTIEPLRYFTEQIAGDRFEVVSIVPGGSSPESYDPTPQQLVELSRSKAYFRIGHIGFEQVWMDRLTDNAPHLQLFDTSEGIDLILGGEHTGGGNVAESVAPHNHHHHSGVEPHVWTSFRNAEIIAGNIVQALSALDPEAKETFTDNYRRFCHMTAHLDSVAMQALSGDSVQRAFMIYHPALSYFARDYDLHQLPIESAGKEPSPAQLKELIDLCRNEQVKTIFIQPEFDKRNARLVARQTGAQVVDINPLSYRWVKEMMHVVQVLAGAEAEEVEQ